MDIKTGLDHRAKHRGDVWEMWAPLSVASGWVLSSPFQDSHAHCVLRPIGFQRQASCSESTMFSAGPGVGRTSYPLNMDTYISSSLAVYLEDIRWLSSLLWYCQSVFAPQPQKHTRPPGNTAWTIKEQLLPGPGTTCHTGLGTPAMEETARLILTTFSQASWLPRCGGWPEETLFLPLAGFAFLVLVRSTFPRSWPRLGPFSLES